MRGAGRLAAVLLSAVLAASVLAGAAAAGDVTGETPATATTLTAATGPGVPVPEDGASHRRGPAAVEPGADPAVQRADRDAPRQLEGIDADGVRLRIQVAPDGDANWTIEYRVQLGEPNKTAAFESLQSDIRANSTEYRDRFGRRMARTAGTAANATGREMAIENVTVEARMQTVPEEFGFVTYRFEWRNFAAVEGDRLVVGDALAGLFLDRGTSLVVAWPTGYEAVDVRPGPPDQRFNSRVVWSGPTDFGSDEPRVVLEPARQGGLPGGGAPAALAAVLALAAVVGAVWWRRSGGAVVGDGPGTPTDGGGPDPEGSAGAAAGAGSASGQSPTAGPASAADGGTTDDADAGGAVGSSSSSGTGSTGTGSGSTPAGPAASAEPGGETAPSTTASQSDPPAGEAPASPGGAGSGETAADGEPTDPGTDADADVGTDPSGDSDAEPADDGSDEDDRVPMELLSPEERVMRLVTERGGRIKQQEVVSELDWSAARTSQVVGSLRESGDIETFRLGRENVLKLPEEDE